MDGVKKKTFICVECKQKTDIRFAVTVTESAKESRRGPFMPFYRDIKMCINCYLNSGANT